MTLPETGMLSAVSVGPSVVDVRNFYRAFQLTHSLAPMLASRFALAEEYGQLANGSFPSVDAPFDAAWDSAFKMPIEPKSPVVSHLADLERGILLHVYDDRGMDVSALTAAPLLPFYKKFAGWLLDYDRERMKAAFAGA